MNVNVDMKLIHTSTIALSYVVKNVIYILRVGCDMNFRENAISLADKSRSSEDQVEYLQKNLISPLHSIVQPVILFLSE